MNPDDEKTNLLNEAQLMLRFHVIPLIENYVGLPAAQQVRDLQTRILRHLNGGKETP